jgi:hypothetical protein
LKEGSGAKEEISIEVKEVALKVPLKGHHYDICLYPNPESSIWQT